MPNKKHPGRTGRPPLPPAELRAHSYGVAFSDAEYLELAAYARSEGRTLASVLREGGLAVARGDVGGANATRRAS